VTLPNNTQRQLTIGATGSGKTQFAAHTLSLRDIDRLPWIIANFKDDELLNAIPHATELDGLTLPKKLPPGIYIARPDIDDWDGMEALMSEIWQRTHIGLMVDEALAISEPRHPAFRRLLTQGRSRRCPVIACTQRPVDVDRYAFSESELITVMELRDDREAAKIEEQTGFYPDRHTLPRFHSYCIQRGGGTGQVVTVCPPVPTFEKILKVFDKKLRKTDSTMFI
jgi:hypothetical protein